MSPVITRQTTINRPAEQVWDALVNPRSIAAWQGGGKVSSNARVGGHYAIFDGATTGEFTLVERPTRLTYTWRQDNWDASWPDSVVSWRLLSQGQKTVVRLRHRRLPTPEELAGHAGGWGVYFLEPLRAWLESRPPLGAAGRAGGARPVGGKRAGPARGAKRDRAPV